MDKKIKKIMEQKDKEKKIEKEKTDKKIEEEFQKRLNDEVEKRVDNEVQRKLSEELKKFEYEISNLKSTKKFVLESDKEKIDVNKKVSMDIPEEIKIEGFDAEMEKLRKKNILTT